MSSQTNWWETEVGDSGTASALRSNMCSEGVSSERGIVNSFQLARSTGTSERFLQDLECCRAAGFCTWLTRCSCLTIRVEPDLPHRPAPRSWNWISHCENVCAKTSKLNQELVITIKTIKRIHSNKMKVVTYLTFVILQEFGFYLIWTWIYLKRSKKLLVIN